MVFSKKPRLIRQFDSDWLQQVAAAAAPTTSGWLQCYLLQSGGLRHNGSTHGNQVESRRFLAGDGRTRDTPPSTQPSLWCFETLWNQVLKSVESSDHIVSILLFHLPRFCYTHRVSSVGCWRQNSALENIHVAKQNKGSVLVLQNLYRMYFLLFDSS